MLGSAKVAMGVSVALGLVACATPRLQDSLAPVQYRAAAKRHELCVPEVEVVRSASRVNRPYREVASLSAVCYPGAPSVCERQLLDRACELRANAIILTEAQAGGTPPGGSIDSRVSQSAVAVRWVAP
jgi:hypothetical protein